MTTSMENGNANPSTLSMAGSSVRHGKYRIDYRSKHRPYESWDQFLVRNMGETDGHRIPPHLGGHLNKTHTDRGVLVHLINNLEINSMIDIGCGPGDMVEIAKDRGLRSLGVDGDWSLKETWNRKGIDVLEHDFTLGPPDNLTEFDLAWSVEFLEHVEEKFVPNFMAVFEQCKYAVVTAAPPGHGGHHHVNEQTQEYWGNKFSEYGFDIDPLLTNEIKDVSTMRKGFMQKNGMFFRKR